MAKINTVYKTGMLNEAQAGALDNLLDQLSAQQALWISGYIAGLYAAQPQTADATAQTEPAITTPVTLLYASETGNARALAEQFADTLSAKRYAVHLYGMEAYPLRQLKDESCLIIIASTHGEGEPPNHARDFYEFLNSRKAPKLKQLQYAVLGLGDSSYEFFCQAAKDVDQRLAELGAQRLHARADCDVDYETDSKVWLETLLPMLEPFRTPAIGVSAPTPVSPQTAVSPPRAVKRSIFSKRNPFPAPLLERIHLNGRGSSKQTLHLEFDLRDSGLEYEPGDALGIVPQNSDITVERILRALDYQADTAIQHNNKTLALHQCLTEKLDIITLTPKLLQQWQTWTSSTELQRILTDTKTAHAFCAGNHLEDLTGQYPAKSLTPQQFVDALRPLQPRLYSISSCQDACPDEVHLTVAKVEYTLHGRRCLGTASGFLATRALESAVPVYVQSNPHFRLPHDPDAPIIMIGAGTGVAPYRAFLQSLDTHGQRRRSWLFFGERHFRTDFLYQTEWQRYLKQGVLTRMDVAFSRDQAEKVYVQHKILAQAKNLYAWLEEGAVLYVCGDAQRLAPDARTALKAVIMQQRACDDVAAEDYLKTLRQNGRYLQDVY